MKSIAEMPWRRLSAWLAAGIVAIAAPGVEHVAAKRLASTKRCTLATSARCHAATWIAVDLDGLRLHEYSLLDPRSRINADEVRVRPSGSGVLVQASGLRGVIELSRDERAAQPPKPPSPGHEPSGPPEDRWWSHGSVTMLAPDGVLLARSGEQELTLRGPALAISTRDAKGSARSFGLAVGPIDVDGHDATFALSRSSGRWSATSQITSNREVTIRASGTRGLARAVMTFSGGGHATLEIGNVRVPTQSIVLSATDLPMVAVSELVGRKEKLDIRDGTFTGKVRLASEARTKILAIEAAEFSGLEVQSRYLAKDPVRMDDLVLTGEVTLEDEDGHGLVALQHGALNAKVSGAWQADRWHAQLEVAPIECQDLLEAMPRGLFDVIGGAQLSGRVAARARLEMAPDLVDAEVEDSPPGRITVDFPFLERCRVIKDPVVIDLEALRGPYRHRFRGDRGKTNERLLAAGIEGFAPVSSIPLLAKAFMIMEDSRFYRHDGFDREQMVRAFWHNFDRGRLARGASTITQQVARNLWLGGDRSMARKLQEAFLTARLEDRLSKTRIIEIYLNIIELGPAIYGVHDAAQYHFGRRPEELDVLEALFIASLAPAPRAFSQRFAHGAIDDAWLEHLHEQARRLYMYHLITHDQLLAGLRSRLDLVDHTSS